MMDVVGMVVSDEGRGGGESDEVAGRFRFLE